MLVQQEGEGSSAYIQVCLLKSISNIHDKGWRNVPNDCTTLWSMQAAVWICQTHGKQYCGQYPDQERKRCCITPPVVVICIIGSPKIENQYLLCWSNLEGLTWVILCKRKLCYIERGKKRCWNTVWGEKAAFGYWQVMAGYKWPCVWCMCCCPVEWLHWLQGDHSQGQVSSELFLPSSAVPGPHVLSLGGYDWKLKIPTWYTCEHLLMVTSGEFLDVASQGSWEGSEVWPRLSNAINA